MGTLGSKKTATGLSLRNIAATRALRPAGGVARLPDQYYLKRIQHALDSAKMVALGFCATSLKPKYKSGTDPVTEADRAINETLQKLLVHDGDGWLSEESCDSPDRLTRKRVWIVDPLDGTREFVTGIPEWCISIALVEDGRPIAAGVCNPATDETFLGCRSAGVTYNGVPASPSHKSTLEQAVVLASRSEVTRGEWKQFEDEVFTLRPTGSVAYKLALIAVGHADVTWTLSPKNEWDIAAGVHLVEAAGGIVAGLDHFPLSFNREETLCSGLYAGGPLLGDEIRSLLTKRCRKALSV